MLHFILWYNIQNTAQLQGIIFSMLPSGPVNNLYNVNKSLHWHHHDQYYIVSEYIWSHSLFFDFFLLVRLDCSIRFRMRKKNDQFWSEKFKTWHQWAMHAKMKHETNSNQLLELVIQYLAMLLINSTRWLFAGVLRKD